MFSLVLRSGRVLEGELHPEFGFDKTRDGFIIVAKLVLVLLGKARSLLSGSSHDFTKADPVILNRDRL